MNKILLFLCIVLFSSCEQHYLISLTETNDILCNITDCKISEAKLLIKIKHSTNDTNVIKLVNDKLEYIKVNSYETKGSINVSNHKKDVVVNRLDSLIKIIENDK